MTILKRLGRLLINWIGIISTPLWMSAAMIYYFLFDKSCRKARTGEVLLFKM